MIATGATGGTVINYSPRFSLSGMTGTFPEAVLKGLKDIDGTKGPPTENNVVDAADGAAPVDGDQFKMPYTMQTGLTRYAPMQKVPPTKISKKNHTPLYPTSAFNIAKSHLPTPKAQTTMTQSQTFSVKSIENTVSVALFFWAKKIRLFCSLGANSSHRSLQPPCHPTTWPSSSRAGRIESGGL